MTKLSTDVLRQAGNFQAWGEYFWQGVIFDDKI
jgi:hypothetical protein